MPRKRFWTHSASFTMTEKMKKYYEQNGKADLMKLLLLLDMSEKGINVTEEMKELGHT